MVSELHVILLRINACVIRISSAIQIYFVCHVSIKFSLMRKREKERLFIIFHKYSLSFFLSKAKQVLDVKNIHMY